MECMCWWRVFRDFSERKKYEQELIIARKKVSVGKLSLEIFDEICIP